LKIITPSFILLSSGLVKNLSVAFDKEVVLVAPLKELLDRFKDAQTIECKADTVLMPGLVNPHVHLEFCANKADLQYGSFIPWLHSVIDKREELLSRCDTKLISQHLEQMLKGGTTAIGAISSYALDLKATATAAQKVRFFSEIIGSSPNMVDALYGDFVARLDESMGITREGFYSGVAIHSPYSVHPVLIKKALKLAKERDLLTTAHLLESRAEREWLKSSSGEFKPFFQKFLSQDRAVNDVDGFLKLFRGLPTLMTHANYANIDELKELSQEQHTLIHCPISNRLLGSKKLDLHKVQEAKVEWILASDGLSSNYTLDGFEQMRAALMMQDELELEPFALELLNGATIRAADALKLNCGAISTGRAADMLLLDISSNTEQILPSHIILHKYPILEVYIDGKAQLGESHGRS